MLHRDLSFSRTESLNPLGDTSPRNTLPFYGVWYSVVTFHTLIYSVWPLFNLIIAINVSRLLSLRYRHTNILQQYI